MKRIITVLSALVFVVSLASAAYAADSRARGTITSYDKKNGVIVFQPDKEGSKSIVLKVPQKLEGSIKLKTKFFISYYGQNLETIREDKGIVIPIGCGSGVRF